MLKLNLTLSLMFVMGLTSCATIKKQDSKTYTDIQPIDQYVKEPIHFINKQMKTLHSQGQLQSLVSWGLGQSKQTRLYLKEQIFMKAQFDYLQAKYPEALLSLEQAINLDDKDDYLKVKYALTLVRLGKLKKAMVALNNVADDNHSQKSLLLLAGIQISLDQVSQARSVYKKILKKNPKAVEACRFLGKSYIKDAHYSKAKKQFRRCLISMPKEASFYYEIAKVNLTQKHSKSAIKNLQKALSINSQYSQAALLIGSIYEQDKKFEKAYQTYDRYLETNPEDFYMLNKMANWFLERNETSKALTYIENLIDLDPSNSNLRVKLGILYVESRQFEKAVSLFDEFLDQNPNEQKVHYYLAAVYQEVKRFEKAIHHYSQVGQKNQLFEDSVLQIATILSSLATDDPSYEDQLSVHIEESIENQNVAIELQVIYASYFEKKENYAQAIEVMKNASVSKGFQESHTLYLVSLYEKNEQFLDVDRELKSLIKKDPTNARALNFLGYFYLERGEKLDEAKTLISKALELRPEDGYIRDSMGWYYYVKGDYQTALTYLTKAYEDSGKDDEVAMHLAQTYQSIGDFENALVYYNELLEKTSNATLKEQLANSVKKVISLKNAKRLPASLEK